MTQLLATAAMVAALSQPGTLPQVQVQATVTFYGQQYEGGHLGCGGTYHGWDVTIAAVGPSRYQQWPCGQQLLIEGPAGSIIVTRQDACPGCSANMVDLSEEANRQVCGYPPHTCSASISEWGP